jgi:hypothetical protein
MVSWLTNTIAVVSLVELKTIPEHYGSASALSALL